MSRHRGIEKTVYVVVDLEDFDTEDLLAELLERRVDAYPDFKYRIERLYYATRGGDPLTHDLQSQVRELLQDLYGRAA